jgi:hypothetical protein
MSAEVVDDVVDVQASTPDARGASSESIWRSGGATDLIRRRPPSFRIIVLNFLRAPGRACAQWDGFRHVVWHKHGNYNGVPSDRHGVHFWAERAVLERRRDCSLLCATLTISRDSPRAGPRPPRSRKTARLRSCRCLSALKRHRALQGWRSIGGRAARQVSAIVPVVTRLPTRNTSTRSGVIRKHFRSYTY